MFKGASGNTNQQSITNVIDAFWQTASCIASVCVCVCACASTCLHMWIIFYSADVTAPGHTHLNMKTLRCNLKLQACNNPENIKNKGGT